MFKELDAIVLTTEIPFAHIWDVPPGSLLLENSKLGKGLKAGDVGTIVHIHPRGEAFVVEFMTLDGNTIAIATVLPSQARLVTDQDITHARTMTMTD